MKNFIHALMLVFLSWLVLLSYNKPEEKFIHSGVQEQLNRLHEVLRRENIVVDWKQISQIDVIPLEWGKLGVYSRTSKAIYISTNAGISFKDYVNTPKDAIEQLRKDFLLIILAHEVAHSQGIDHINSPESIMAASDEFIVENIKEIGAEELVLRTYRQLDTLKVTHPIR